MTTTDVEQEYHAFCEMVRKMTSSALRDGVASDWSGVMATLESLNSQAIERKKELEVRAELNAPDRYDLTTLPKPSELDERE